MYLSGVMPWKSSKWEAPPPEEISRIRKEAGVEPDGVAENGLAAGGRGSDETGEISTEKADNGNGTNDVAVHKETGH